MIICGMHVHVGLDDDELRIDVMNQLTYFVPHLLALSCSSPFWEGDDMGMQSFRLMLLSSLPRTGLPERFESYGEFRRHLDALVRNGLIEDTTKIWWDIRPSSRYPTLETRVFDCCTHLDDAVCLAALNLSLVRMLYRLRRENKIWRRYPRMLIAENRWRAMRFGSDASLLDLARGELVPFAELLEELLALMRDDADGARLPGGDRTCARAAQARHQRAPAARRLPDGALAGRHRRRGAVGGGRLAGADDLRRSSNDGRHYPCHWRNGPHLMSRRWRVAHSPLRVAAGCRRDRVAMADACQRSAAASKALRRLRRRPRRRRQAQSLTLPAATASSTASTLKPRQRRQRRSPPLRSIRRRRCR